MALMGPHTSVVTMLGVIPSIVGHMDTVIPTRMGMVIHTGDIIITIVTIGITIGITIGGDTVIK